MENQKTELKGRVLGFSVTVANALDAAFGGGKGKILENWLKVMDDLGKPERSGTNRSSLSPGAKAFFGGAPVVSKKG
ncbi:MAG: hypothetical protein WC443_10090 [Desulfobaccales bacterium]